MSPRGSTVRTDPVRRVRRIARPASYGVAVTTTTSTWAAELSAALGEENVLTDPAVPGPSAGHKGVRPGAGPPAAVVFARSTDDVVAVMQVASRHGVPVVPRGA